MCYPFSKMTRTKRWLGLVLTAACLIPIESQGAVETTYYETTLDGCKYKITSTYYSTTRETDVFATLYEFGLPSGTEFSLPGNVVYTDRYNSKRVAPVKFYKESVVRDCEAMVSAKVYLKDNLSSNSNYSNCENLFLSDPNLESITFVSGYRPSLAAFNFIYDCPKLSELKADSNCDGFKDGVMYITKSNKKNIQIYPPAKTDKIFDLSDYTGAEEAAFKGISNLTGFSAGDYAEKDFSVRDNALYNQDGSVLIAAVNTPDGIFTVPASVTRLGIFSTAAATLKEFRAEDGSPFIAKDGVIYDSEGKLMAYPMAKEDNMFVVTEGDIDKYAFYFPENLSTLIDLTDTREKNYARFLKPGTTLLVKNSYVDETRNYHSNTHSFSSFFTDATANTGSYQCVISLPEGWSPISVRFTDVDEYPAERYNTAAIAIKDNKITATGLWPYSIYRFILVCKDSSGNVLEIPSDFETAGVKLTFVESTQKTIKIKVDAGDTKANLYVFDIDNVKSGELTKSDLIPDTKYQIIPYVVTIGNDGYGLGCSAGEKLEVYTKSLNMTLSAIETGPTSITVKCTWTEDDAKVTDYSIIYGKETISSKSATAFVTGLNPESSYSFTVRYTIDDKHNYSFSKAFSTTALELATLQPKVVQPGKAIVCGESNIRDIETNAGFQWRKLDAPASLKSNEAFAPVWSGTIEGFINNLQPTSYYNVRTFYRSTTGNEYFGKWVTFDPSDFTWFEPTVHTYAATDITYNSINIKGVVMQGSEPFISQGFEYWIIAGGDKASVTYAEFEPAAENSDVVKVLASGQVMNARLTDLQPDTEYAVRSFVETETGTYYGEEQTFRTLEYSGVENIAVDNEVKIIRYFNASGMASDKPFNGFNIIVFSDGHSEKHIIK